MTCFVLFYLLSTALRSRLLVWTHSRQDDLFCSVLPFVYSSEVTAVGMDTLQVG